MHVIENSLGQTLNDVFICPLSLSYIIDPVIASDGCIYEKDMITKYIQKEQINGNVRSPITMEMMSTQLISSAHIKNIMHAYYNENNIRFPFGENNYDGIVSYILRSSEGLNDIFSDINLVNLLIEKYVRTHEFILENYLVRYGRKNDLINIRLLTKYSKENKFNLNVVDENNWSPIHFVCSNFNVFDGDTQLEAIKILLSAGVDIETETNHKWRPIHFVCSSSNNLGDKQVNAIELLINTGVSLEHETADGRRPVHFICSSNNNFNAEKQLSAIKLFIRSGVNFNVKQPGNNKTPIHFVCSNENKLDSGTQINAIRSLIKLVDINAKDAHDFAPIHYVCSDRNKFNSITQQDAIKLLVESGADLEVSDNDGWRPIHYVCSNDNNMLMDNQVEMIKYLMNVDLEAETSNGWKPIHFICSTLNNLNKDTKFKIIRKMMKRGVDVKSRTHDGHTSLSLINGCCYRNFTLFQRMILFKL